VATLETPEKLRELQRALYQRAKREPHFRAYALYDKVYRQDVLAHAYALVKAKAGAPGPDGETFEDIEARGRVALLEELHEELKSKSYRPGPVRRVYIPKLGGGERPLGIPNIRDRVVQMAAKLLLEPLYEADFGEESYGFRPRKNAHQALDAVQAALEEGMCWIIDADINGYFDAIPHERLMKAVAERVVDGAMLALVKRFLEAPIVDERDGGGPRRNREGTPQGGVISPLLANIYLNLMDRNFRRRVVAGELQGRLVRYADDFLVLCSREPGRELAWVKQLMGRLGLQLHAKKTRVVDARRETFDFLGHNHRWQARRLYLDISKKALGRIREEMRWRTKRTFVSLPTLVREMNEYVRGARQYFRRVLRRRLFKLDTFLRDRVARWGKHKHALDYPAWSLVKGRDMWTRLGLERWYFLSTAPPASTRSTK
jgi:RNA-directed DNA polymerase